jgi:DNA-binding NtrC family response regulator
MQSNPAILVVDDEETVRNVAREILKTGGYEALAAGTEETAVALLRENRDAIELVLLDAGMMQSRNRNIVASLLEISPEVVIVVSSGCAAEDALRQFGPGRAPGFLQKPYTASCLRDAVGLALRDRTISCSPD